MDLTEPRLWAENGAGRQDCGPPAAPSVIPESSRADLYRACCWPQSQPSGRGVSQSIMRLYRSRRAKTSCPSASPPPSSFKPSEEQRALPDATLSPLSSLHPAQGPGAHCRPVTQTVCLLGPPGHPPAPPHPGAPQSTYLPSRLPLPASPAPVGPHPSPQLVPWCP